MTTNDTSTKTGILLALIDGEWTTPCGCRFHFFDGEPKAHLLTASGYWQYTGKPAPHVHACPAHGDSFYRLPPESPEPAASPKP